MAQFDQSFEAQPPSEKQFEYAQNLALQTSTAMPPEAHTDRSVCSTFIDECRAKMPPSAKQLAFAEKLAEGAGVALPPDTAVNMVACSEFIDRMVGGDRSSGGGYAGASAPAVDPNQPTDKQLLFACQLAQEANCDLPAEALRSKRDCSSFIEGLQRRKEGEGSPAPADALPLERFQDTDIPF